MTPPAPRAKDVVRSWRFDGYDWHNRPVSGVIVAKSEGVARYKARREMVTQHHSPNPHRLRITEVREIEE